MDFSQHQTHKILIFSGWQTENTKTFNYPDFAIASEHTRPHSAPHNNSSASWLLFQTSLLSVQ